MCWNIFAAPGSGYAESQNQQNASASANAAQLMNQLYPGLSQDYQYAQQLEPQRQQDIGTMLMGMSEGNVKNQEDAYQREAMANANTAANQAAGEAQGQGLSSAYTQGNDTATNNAAANASNQFNAYEASPEAQLQRGAARLSLYGQGQTSPFAQPFQQMTSDVFGAPRVQVGQSPLGAIAGIAGDFLGSGGLGSLFGGGGSSSQGGGPSVNYSPFTGGGFDSSGGGSVPNYGNSGFGNSGFGGGMNTGMGGSFGGLGGGSNSGAFLG